MKFVLYIDYKAEYKPMYCEYKTMNAKTLEDAIEEADKAWNENVYLARIMKKEGKTERKDGCSVEKFNAVLCRRSFGWHRNTRENGESAHSANRYAAKYGDWFEIA